MNEHFLYPLFRKLRPEMAELAGQLAYEPFLEFMISIYLLPFAFFSLIWLSLVTTPTLFTDNWIPLLLFGVALYFIQSRQAVIPFEIAQGTRITVISSLSGVAVWCALLIWGVGALWIDMGVSLIRAIQGSWRRSRYQQDAFWQPLAIWLQEISGALVSGLIVLSLYQVLGGVLPFAEVTILAVLAVLGIVLLDTILSSLLLMPVVLQINKLISPQTNTIKGVLSIMLNVSLASLVTTPFALLFALLYTRGSVGIYLFGLLALVLVNLLAHYLSRMNQRSQQGTREMAQLEALGQAILQAPPDGSTLPELLRSYVGRMFQDSQDWVEIRIFPGEHLAGFAGQLEDLQIVHPANRPALPEVPWQELQQTEEPHLVIKAVTPPGMRAVYGDAVLDKITDARPNQEGEGACIGGTYLLRHHTAARTIDSLAAVQALGSQIATAIYRAQVYAETLASQKMSQELEFAGRIQASFLPDTVPDVAGWEISADLIPARQTAGDFYDFIPLSDGRLGLLVADVADKGTGAALYMALSRTLLRTYAMEHPDQPDEVLRLTNERILADTRANQFVTVFYGVLDPANGALLYANGGHNPVLRLPVDNGSHEAYIRTGPPLGVMPEMAWEQARAQIEPGDALVLYTDGVTEAQDIANAFYTDARLLATAQSHQAQDSAGLHAAILTDVQIFVGEAAQFDDITLVVLKRKVD